MPDQVAQAWPRAAASGSPSLRAQFVAQADTLRGLGRDREAATALERALEEYGGNPLTSSILSELARTYADTGQTEAAFRTYIRLADADPESCSEMLGKAGDLVSEKFAGIAASWLEAEWRWLKGWPADPSVEAPDYARLALAASVFSSAKQHARGLGLFKHAASAVPEGSRRDLADRLYEIGDKRSGDNDLDLADAYLRAAVQVDPDHVNATFLRSELLRRRSYTDTPPYVNVEDIREAEELWTRAAGKGEPLDSWACGLRSLILEQVRNGTPADRWRLSWEAVAYAERSRLIGGSPTYYSALLGRWYRFLGLTMCEDYATAEALELALTDEDRRTALEERIITTSNSGRIDLARQLIDERRKFDTTAWLDAVQASMLVRSGEPGQALSLVDAWLKASAQNIWCYEVRGECYRALADIEGIKDVYRSIWSKYDAADIDNIQAYSRAGCWVAVLEGEATGVFEILAKYRTTQALPTDFGALLISGECCLASGEIERGRKLIEAGIEQCRNSQDLEDLRREVRDMARFHHDPSRGAAIARALEEPGSGIEAAIAKRMAFLSGTPITPEHELQALIAERGESDADGWLRIGALAGIARMSAAAGARELARRSYEELLAAEPVRFPEAKRVLEQMAESDYSAADEALERGDYSGALDAYNKLTTSAAAAHLREGILAGIGCAKLLRGDNDAGESLRTALSKFQASEFEDATSRFARRLEALVRSESELWTVWDAICDRENESAKAGAAIDVPQARATLLTWIDQKYGLEGAGAAASGPPTHIFLEIGDGLIPKDTSENWILFREYIPEMRARFRSNMGVTVPGIRVRGNLNLKANEYSILIDEVLLPLERGCVELGARYSPATQARLVAAGIGPEQIKEAINRGTGYRGCWLKEDAWEAATAAGLPLQAEPLVFVLQHLEGVLMRNLEEFLRLDDVEALLAEWQADGAVKGLIETVLPSSRSRFYFSRLVRTLVRARVPLAQPLEVLASLRDFRLDAESLPAAARRVRRAVKSSLPGNADGWLRIRIPPGLEAQALSVAEGGGGVAERTELLISALRNQFDLFPFEEPMQGIALIASRDRAAAVLREIAESEFLNVTALSGEEADG